MQIPRFHPIQCEDGWFVCDGRADVGRGISQPCEEAPLACEDRDEALKICAILNADHSNQETK